ncbi:MAG TPA: hypothetical protein VFC46_07740, partial [Humisphaera sp.]|nr:hypothetical protein [Humisphaera sp.]
VVDSGIVHVSSGASITSAATGTGNAGTVSILAGKRFTLDSLGSVTTQSALSNGGDITISAKRGIAVVNSLITATAAADAGSISITTPGTLDIAGAHVVTEAGHNGGNITLTPELATLNRVRISANAGNNGGNIRIRPQALLATPDTRITATGTRGVSGQIEVTSPDQTIASSVARLPTSLYGADLTLQPQCGQMTGMMNVSSFVVSGRGGVPLAPGTWQMDFDILRLSSPTTEPNRKPFFPATGGGAKGKSS